ncbi:unnamed protein product [Hydatigera taeniaeformis]|uniref:MCM_N domain-containing protein n=1 Tax=Hydatigena taeniaeformis TaxID=6205 RepID=A0A0R3WLY3_HYDTA|nr:unnamed protein product [Hydatigera taeniaeformis]
MTKDERIVNSFALSHLSLAYRSHLLNAEESDFLDLLRKDITSMEKYMIERRNAGKGGVLHLVAEDIVAFLRLYEGLLLDNEANSIIELHRQDTFLHAFNRRCLLTEYADSEMPKVVSGRVVAVGRFTMDLTMRDVIRQINHLPVGHAFYFVVLDFDASFVSESTRNQVEYGITLSKLSGRQVNVLEAVGHDVNDKLSLDLKRTGVYFVDELSSLPDVEHQESCEEISPHIPLSQLPVRCRITPAAIYQITSMLIRQHNVAATSICLRLFSPACHHKCEYEM